mmetsp:Transcript_4909/g.21017  ORF Transcript_4909/g.21017 Transcript_4909/m.21017 type:complete len:205 (-) Transcript_4909:374-988(-)
MHLEKRGHVETVQDGPTAPPSHLPPRCTLSQDGLFSTQSQLKGTGYSLQTLRPPKRPPSRHGEMLEQCLPTSRWCHPQLTALSGTRPSRKHRQSPRMIGSQAQRRGRSPMAPALRGSWRTRGAARRSRSGGGLRPPTAAGRTASPAGRRCPAPDGAPRSGARSPRPPAPPRTRSPDRRTSTRCPPPPVHPTTRTPPRREPAPRP